ncbi:MAG: hypothetical protein MJZ28_11660 [Paludibacteraceae bacterium]|nr:hypothetical protein [Paludibacteraceae bacterium]
MKSVKLSVIAATALMMTGCASETQRQAENVKVNVEKVQGVEAQLEAVATPDEAMARLIEGNARYVADSCINPHHNQKRVEATAPHQAPFAAVVACSDSRVPVELLFDQGVGDIFVIRTAGNSVNGDLVMGSVDYAVEHLGVKALIVLGHESCGGVTGAISEVEKDDDSKIDELLSVIREDVKPYVGKIDSLDAAVKMNANAQLERIMKSKHVQTLVNDGKLVVKSAYYNVHSGKVEF